MIRFIARLETAASDLRAWIVQRKWALLATAHVAAAFFALYLLTGRTIALNTSYADFPFGIDTPTFVFYDGSPELHNLMTKVLRAYARITDALGLERTALVVKFPYAVMGAAYVLTAIAAFAVVIGRLNALAMLGGACCGSSLMVWLYAAMPESYMLSTLLYAVYLAVFVAAATRGPNDAIGAGAAIALFFALLNDVSALAMLIAPLCMYGLRLAKEPLLRRIVLYHVAAIAGFMLTQVFTVDLHALYVDLFQAYSPLTPSSEGAARPEAETPLHDPFFQYFFYTLAAPTVTTTHAPWANYPDYFGYFGTSPLGYLTNVTGLAFIAVYGAVLAYWRPLKMNRLALSLSAFVLVRFILAWAFNPIEVIIYASVAIMPLLIILLTSAGAKHQRRSLMLATAMTAAMLLDNGRFLFTVLSAA